MKYSISRLRNFTLGTIPEAVGYWQLPGADKGMSVQFSAWKKPRWFTIKMMWWVFEWKWIEAKQ
jgi:hypothetical protein